MAFIYSDLNGFSTTTKPLLVDIESIYQSIYNILNTRTGERLFEPDFGIDLEGELFEPGDDITTLAILQEIISAVSKYEGRVKIDNANSTVTVNRETNEYELELIFSVVGVEDQNFTLRGNLT